jgi:hypothetical protein
LEVFVVAATLSDETPWGPRPLKPDMPPLLAAIVCALLVSTEYVHGTYLHCSRERLPPLSGKQKYYNARDKRSEIEM